MRLLEPKWKGVAVYALAALLAFPNQVFAAGWMRSSTPKQERGLQSGWWYSSNEMGTEWYASDKPGNTAWHWLDGNKDGTAECYAFDHDGWMYSDTTTPDGYTVDRNGAWVVNGAVQTKAVHVPGVGTYTSRPSSSGKGGGGGGSGGHSSGGGHTSIPSSPLEPDKETERYSYTVRLLNQDGGILKEIQGKAEAGAYLSLGQYQVDGYVLMPDQELTAVLQSDGEVFTVYFQKKTDTATDSEAERLYSYTIHYVDVDTKLILGTVIGQATQGSVIDIDHPDIEDYEICDGQPTELEVESDDLVQKIYYQEVKEATPSEPSAQKVKWIVHFVDQDDHSNKIWPSQSGKIADGGELTVNYPPIIYSEDGTVWESIEEPPVVRQIYGTGTYIEYIEFANTGEVPDGEDPYEEEQKKLKGYLDQAKACESMITGEDTEKIPDQRFIVLGQMENDHRIRSLATQINDTDDHTFYVIGKNFVPNGKTIAAWFGEEAVYSNLLEDVIRIQSDTYYIARMGIKRSFSKEGCSHNWKWERGREGGCLEKGSALYICQKCGAEQEIITAPLGHIDKNNDSICDRCKKRAIPQAIGSKIQAELGGKELTFTCIADEYQGGMLYLADQTLELSTFGGYGAAEYGQSNPRKYFRDGFQNGFSIKNGLMGITGQNFSGTDYAMSLTQEDYEAYKERIDGGGFLLQDSEEGKVLGVDENGGYTLEDISQSTYGIRPAIVMETPDEGTADTVHWNIGDIQARELDGQIYMFRCIDQNYSDAQQNHRKAALFICDSVIPANYGSDYEIKQTEDGSHRYVFAPGPIVNFGNSNEYKYSSVYKWLEQQESVYNMEPTHIGVNYAYMGNSPEQEFANFDDNSFSSYYIGSQKLQAKFFILSLDEAIQYKDFMWKFEGSDKDNPETQYGSFSKGFWLRSPMGNSDNYDTGYAYIVDLVNGNIHPAAIKPQKDLGNEELNVTTTTGVRPAFTMPQD